MREQGVGQRQVAALERNRTVGLLDQPARREARNFGPLRLIEPDKRALAARRAERPTEARMQAAGVRRRLGAGIGDFDRNRQRVGSEPVFDRKREGERIDRPCPRIVGERKPGEVGA